MKIEFICIIIIIITTIVLSTVFAQQQQTTKIRKQNAHYSVKLGDTVTLTCNIENRKRSTVIWQYVKSRRPPETLTIGFLQYRQDYRIRVVTNLTSEALEVWDLEIRKVRLEDEGYYVCRVMTDGETLKRQVHLKVEVSMSITPTNPVVNVKDAIILYCNTSYVHNSDSTANNMGIEWYKNTELHPLYYNYNANGSNYKIETTWTPTLSSQLKIMHVKATNIATYICRFRSQNVSTTLHKSNSFNRKNLKVTNIASSAFSNTRSIILFSIVIIIAKCN